MPNLYFFNTSFDFDLSGGLPERYISVCREMSLYAIFCGSKKDRVYSTLEVDDSYYEYLSRYGFESRFINHITNCTSFTGVAWGWNFESKNLFDQCGAVYDYPEFEIVKTANSRETSSLLAKELRLPSAGLTFFTRDSLEKYLNHEKFRPLILKPVFGSSGAGFIILTEQAVSEKARGRLSNIFIEGQGICVEPFLDRVDDFSANFTLNKDGSVTGLTFHKGIISQKGQFSGIILYPDNSFLGRHEDLLMQTVSEVAKKLHTIGYFGPAGIDAFTYRENSVIKLNPMCEINARLTMAEVARSLKSRLGGRYGMLKQVRSYCIGLDSDIKTLSARFGDDWYNSDTQKGIFLATPPILKNGEKPHTSIFYIAADSESEIIRLSELLRR